MNHGLLCPKGLSNRQYISYVPQTQEDALLSEAQSHIAQADDGGES